ncbi:hypothetical protein FA95DRAFT_1564923 [Auriscalpium vulgare]|uniref:Uncharacterized protein n=1 Tax=Auriscalpium vulgare TaxID=40419 RepID=A0ACB8RD55_9AGAM|nr:hypothetical protein FA95DRAFT_1564923 [Auriscalpium vulgare]
MRFLCLGCIPSKRQVLEFDDEKPPSQLKVPKPKKYKKQKAGPESPVVYGESPPWVTGHQVFKLSADGNGGSVVSGDKSY